MQSKINQIIIYFQYLYKHTQDTLERHKSEIELVVTQTVMLTII